MGTYIIDNFELKEIQKSSINFINEAIEKGGQETEDVIVLQLFHKFYEDNELSIQIMGLLEQKSLNVFERFFEKYYK